MIVPGRLSWILEHPIKFCTKKDHKVLLFPFALHAQMRAQHSTQSEIHGADVSMDVMVSWPKCPVPCSVSDIDECAVHMDRCNRSVSDCINTEGGYVCKCLEGYTGDGVHCYGMSMCEGPSLSGRLMHFCLCDSFLPVWSVVTSVIDQYAKLVVVSEYLLSVFALFLVAIEKERGRVKGRREVEVKQ